MLARSNCLDIYAYMHIYCHDSLRRCRTSASSWRLLIVIPSTCCVLFDFPRRRHTSLLSLIGHNYYTSELQLWNDCSLRWGVLLLLLVVIACSGGCGGGGGGGGGKKALRRCCRIADVAMGCLLLLLLRVPLLLLDKVFRKGTFEVMGDDEGELPAVEEL